MALKSINPVNGEVIGSYPEDKTEQVNSKLTSTQLNWLSWKNTTFGERAGYLNNTATILREKRNELSELMALEMGKPIKDGIAEIEKCAAVCEYYAAHAEAFLKDEIVDTDASKSYITFQPLGVVLAIMPWNFPFWQLFRFLAPALMAGNCGVLKHASSVSGCALAVADVLKEAGLPDHTFTVLLVKSSAIQAVIAHPAIKAVTLTGSTEAGKQVAQQAAKHLKKTVLELGGSDPYIVLDDADLEAAAETCAQSRLVNNGQSCIAAKRFIVVKEVYDDFLTLFKAKMERRITGHPFEKGTELGPMSRKDLRDQLHQQVRENIEAGAKCVLGGEIPEFDGDHAFYMPTILTGILKGMPAYEEELFGPVALVIEAKDTEEAIAIANDTVFGLGAAVFTQDDNKGEEIARNRLNAGSCFVNGQVKSDPKLPFGGINQSGYGRELGPFGIREFVNIKTVYLK